MKKVFITVACVALAIIAITYNPPEQAVSQLPDGVYSFGDVRYYVIKLPGGTAVLNRYFTLEGASGMVVVDRTDANSYSKNLGTVYYSQVQQGGWVAYQKSGTDCVLYIPGGIPDKDVKIVSSRLAYGAERYLTLEEAREYVPWL